MTKEMYESLPLSELRQVAKARGLKGMTALRKAELIAAMLREDAKQEAQKQPETAREAQDPAAESQAKVQEPQAKAEEASAAVQAGTEEPEKKAQQERNGNSERRPRPARQYTERTERAREPRNRDAKSEENRTRTRTGAERPQRRGQWHAGNRERTEAAEHIELHEQSENQEKIQHTPEMAEVKTEAAAPAGNEEWKMEMSSLDSGQEARGILEVLADGYGFIRSDNFLPGENDVYVSPSQIRKFGLKTGDMLYGNTRVKSPTEKFSALLYVKSINGLYPSVSAKRPNFENMTPIFPNERIRLERPGGSMAMRIVDLISPIGKGQRGMIVSPPKAGKTTLLKDAAKSILKNNPEMHLIILLIDERPEEVTDMKETVQGPNVEVIYSTFDEMPEHHKRVSEMVIERAKRLVENKRDVVIFIDSITRLARAYNQVVPPSGRTLSGGLDPAALHMPKRFFGAARNMREGGSLTILATALVDTGSKMDDVVYEEFKGTGNMELVLDRKLQERRVFPAVDIVKSGTRREDLLLTKEEQETVNKMRRALNGMKADEAVENILNMFSRTRDNEELIRVVQKQRVL